VRAIRFRYVLETFAQDPTLHPPHFAQISRVHDRSCPHSRARDWRKCRNIQLHRRLVYQAAALPTTRPAGDLRDAGQETRMDKRGSYFRSGLFRFSEANTLFEQTVAWGGASLNLTGDGLPELVDGGRVSWNFFDTLGAKPILGRTFTAEDDRSGAPHVAILSQGLWQGRYAGDPKSSDATSPSAAKRTQ